MPPENRKHDLIVNLAFALGLVLLVVPDTFAYGSILNSRLFFLDLAGTVADAVLFSAVFILLKIQIGKRRAANEELLRANRLKSEFLQIAAHDLRNPLNAILLLALSSPPEEREALGRIRANAEEMMAIIKGFLDTAALESGNLKLHRSRVDLSETVRQTVERNRPQAERKGMKLACEAGSPCEAECDPGRIAQAVDNLVSNAIKFSFPGSFIQVSVRPLGGGGGVRIEVADEGPGLSVADRKLLFGRFARLSARPTSGEASTGLGLANARQLVELHGGRIGAESAGPGQGSLFWIELGEG